jgi:hypothetical protein
MPRKAKAAPQKAPKKSPAPQPAQPAAQPTTKTESIAGYFRRLFKENPRLLKERSNEELLRRWLADHPGHSEVPESVKQGQANIKSILRRKLKRKRDPAAQRAAQPARGKTPTTAATEENPLERLEYLIDRCLAIARDQNAKGMEGIIGHLRQARNELVLRLSS